MISIDDFKKLEIKIGTVVSAERIEGADKLLKLMIDLGNEEPVQILSGIAEFYEPDFLLGKQIPVIVNLEPRTMKGLVSNGMLLAADGNRKPVLLHPSEQVPPGSMVK